jgi:hypothetical protein
VKGRDALRLKLLVKNVLIVALTLLASSAHADIITTWRAVAIGFIADSLDCGCPYELTSTSATFTINHTTREFVDGDFFVIHRDSISFSGTPYGFGIHPTSWPGDLLYNFKPFTGFAQNL